MILYSKQIPSIATNSWPIAEVGASSSQSTMIPPLHDDTHTNPPLDELAARRFDEFAKSTGALIKEHPFAISGNNGEYHDDLDEIRVRERSQWSSRPVGYYHTLAHELIHWTGPRLGREMGADLPDPKRVLEELVAEYGAVRLTKHFGVYAPRPSGNKLVTDYFAALPDQKAALIYVEREAVRAVQYLLNFTI